MTEAQLLHHKTWLGPNSIVSKVVITRSPSPVEASHNGLMRQFELYAVISPTYSTCISCCMPSGWYVKSVHLLPWQASQRLSMGRYHQHCH